MSAVVVVGAGYGGLPSALRAVAAGHDVAGYDTDQSRVKRLLAGELHVADLSGREPADALESKRFRPTAHADLCADFDSVRPQLCE